MPTYEYRCRECGHELEAVQSFDDDALTTCPDCGGALRKKFGAPGIAFKGSGFYKTDSRSSAGGGNGASKDTSKPNGSDGSSTADKSAKADKADAPSKAGAAASSSASTPSSSSSSSTPSAS